MNPKLLVKTLLEADDLSDDDLSDEEIQGYFDNLVAQGIRKRRRIIISWMDKDPDGDDLYNETVVHSEPISSGGNFIQTVRATIGFLDGRAAGLSSGDHYGPYTTYYSKMMYRNSNPGCYKYTLISYTPEEKEYIWNKL